jgi:hypothetical protein
MLSRCWGEGHSYSISCRDLGVYPKCPALKALFGQGGRRRALVRAWLHCSSVATFQLFICSVLRRWETSDFQVKGLHSNGGVCMLKNMACPYRIPNDCFIKSSKDLTSPRTHARPKKSGWSVPLRSVLDALIKPHPEISTRTANTSAFGELCSLHNVETQ